MTRCLEMEACLRPGIIDRVVPTVVSCSKSHTGVFSVRGKFFRLGFLNRRKNQTTKQK